MTPRQTDMCVAADTNILRQRTTRRYLASLEGMRERRVLVLPTVDLEMQRHVGIVAARYIQRKFGKSRRATRERAATGGHESGKAGAAMVAGGS